MAMPYEKITTFLETTDDIEQAIRVVIDAKADNVKLVINASSTCRLEFSNHYARKLRDFLNFAIK